MWGRGPRLPALHERPRARPPARTSSVLFGLKSCFIVERLPVTARPSGLVPPQDTTCTHIAQAG